MTNRTTPDIDRVWARIQSHAGETFRQIRGREFTYEARANYLTLKQVQQNIPRNQVEQALELVPLANTMPLQQFRAPSYLYAILMDRRIRQDHW